MEPTPKTIQERVQEAIATGKVTMKPKWHFVLQTILFALGVGVITCAVLYLSSFILFILRENGLLFVPLFGPRGWYVFLVSLPWLLVLLLGLFIIVLELLVRHYAFAYRRPLVFTAVGILVMILVGAVSIETTPFHKQVFVYSERSLPMARFFYHHFDDEQPRDVEAGRIVTTTPNGFVLLCRRGDFVRVLITEETRLPPDGVFSIGDAVVIFGERVTSSIRAFGIRVLHN